jgi:hypothetical protein
MRTDGFPNGAGRLQRGASGGYRRACVPLRGQEGRSQAGEGCKKIDEKRYVRILSGGLGV